MPKEPSWEEIRKFIEDNIRSDVHVAFSPVKVISKEPLLIVGDQKKGEPMTERYYCMKDHEQGNCDLGPETGSVLKHAKKHLEGSQGIDEDCW